MPTVEGKLLVTIYDQRNEGVEKFNLSTVAVLTNAGCHQTKTIYLPPAASFLFCDLLRSSQSYQKSCLKFWTENNQCSRLRIKFSDNIEVVDYHGCLLASVLLWQMIELEDALHWLSTLGGAFSNLGEHDHQFAVRAGSNAMKQLMVAMKFGDKTVVVKCWLFIGQSLLQQKKYKQSAEVLRSVWEICNRPPFYSLSSTEKLRNMCKGVWARLKHERNKRMTQCLEIEQKFSVPKDYKTSLLSAGATLVSTKPLKDVYWDTPELSLLKQDVWLRQRESTWELKVPIGDSQYENGVTQYREVEGRVEVEKEVASYTEAIMNDMVVLVTVESKRESWQLNKFNITIDSLIEDNWSVGEVELVVTNQSEMENARVRVQELASNLGFTFQKYGKVRHCLRNQNPRALKVLQELN